MQFVRQLLQIGRDQQEALGFEGTSNAGDSGGKLFFEQFASLRCGDTVFERTFQNVGEHQAEFLEFGKDDSRGLPFRRDLKGVEDRASFTLEQSAGRVKKIGVEFRSNPTEEERLNVNRAIPCNPFQTLEATKDVRRVSELSTAVTGEKYRIWHA